MIVEILQFFLALAEIGVCFWACDKLIYHGEVVGRHRGYFAVCTCLIAAFIVYNRRIAFLSLLVLFFEVCIIWLIIFIRVRKKALLSFMFILDSLLFMLLMDLALSFFAINILDEGYWNSIYFGISAGRILIYTLSRFLMFAVCYILSHLCKKVKVQC